MSAIYQCDNCGSVLQPGEERQKRFRRGDVEIIVRAHYKKRQPQSCHVCTDCVRKAVNEPDPPPPPEPPPPGMVEFTGMAAGAPPSSELPTQDDTGPNVPEIVPHSET
jgi:hypothetical protein